jgi:DNA-directed RNA polymerase I, II, and III subunit RPABC2
MDEEVFYEEEFSGDEEGGFLEEDAPLDEKVEETDEIDENDDEASADTSILSRVREARHELIPVDKVYETYYSKAKMTKPFLTKFERAKVLGVRAEMIASGSPSTVVVPRGMTSAYEIAKLELQQKKIPLMIKRYLPSGATELWRLEDLIY